MTATSQALEPLSLEHQQALRVCENIRKGLSQGVDKERIRKYTNWFKRNYLDPHFDLEEQFIFPLLGNNVRVKKALANHRRINKLLSCDCDNERVLNLLEEELSTFIRYEERVLFKEIVKKVGPEELLQLQTHHDSIVFNEEDWKDKFWKS
ncbi:hemerythrin domain-containing protein [Salinimicrobium terrae]|uniref:hemerythrin domain-containing protein n=1 Tax=Salinimicrobium terrae TaxID=470866 RepID=UPI0003FEBAAE|nr:hemerythrin domain-containing protein [Salinimicrobium terrae]